jgi:hypothetical protein
MSAGCARFVTEENGRPHECFIGLGGVPLAFIPENLFTGQQFQSLERNLRRTAAPTHPHFVLRKEVSTLEKNLEAT